MNCYQACGPRELEALADAKTVGLPEEFKCGVDGCCQISAWTDEESLACFEALQTDVQIEDALEAIEE